MVNALPIYDYKILTTHARGRQVVRRNAGHMTAASIVVQDHPPAC